MLTVRWRVSTSTPSLGPKYPTGLLSTLVVDDIGKGLHKPAATLWQLWLQRNPTLQGLTEIVVDGGVYIQWFLVVEVALLYLKAT